MAWTDQAVDILRTMWARGFSANIIANELGMSFTRSSVIGKVHRLGLNGHGGSEKGAMRAAIPRPKRRKSRPRPGPPKPQLVEILAPTPEQDLATPLEQRRTLFNLTNTTCRWPVGDPSSGDFFFCGAAADNSVSPYCVYHQRAAYQTTR